MRRPRPLTSAPPPTSNTSDARARISQTFGSSGPSLQRCSERRVYGTRGYTDTVAPVPTHTYASQYLHPSLAKGVPSPPASPEHPKAHVSYSLSIACPHSPWVGVTCKRGVNRMCNAFGEERLVWGISGLTRQGVCVLGSGSYTYTCTWG